MLAYQLNKEDNTLTTVSGDPDACAHYELNKDYHTLLALVKSGLVVVCFVNYKWSVDIITRDVAMFYDGNFRPRNRGMSYGKIVDPNSGSFECDFIQNCIDLKLEYLVPHKGFPVLIEHK